VFEEVFVEELAGKIEDAFFKYVGLEDLGEDSAEIGEGGGGGSGAGEECAEDGEEGRVGLGSWDLDVGGVVKHSWTAERMLAVIFVMAGSKSVGVVMDVDAEETFWAKLTIISISSSQRNWSKTRSSSESAGLPSDFVERLDLDLTKPDSDFLVLVDVGQNISAIGVVETTTRRYGVRRAVSLRPSIGCSTFPSGSEEKASTRLAFSIFSFA